MDFVSVRELAQQSDQIWEQLSKSGELVITSEGKPIALLSAVTAETLEETLRALRRARAQVAVSQLRAAAQATGTDRLTMDEIEAEIRATRQDRR